MATKKATKRPQARDESPETWTDDELAAIKEHNRELRVAKSRGKNAADLAAEGEADLLAKIKEMPQPDRGLAERIHAIVKTSAPALTSRTYYGMPAYARDGKVVCFFQPAAKFKARYSTLGFNDAAKLDDGDMWATSWALTKLSAADEKKIAALVRQAAS